MGLDLTPQLEVAEQGMYAKADLGSAALRLVLEAEGYETHGTRSWQRVRAGLVATAPPRAMLRRAG